MRAEDPCVVWVSAPGEQSRWGGKEENHMSEGQGSLGICYTVTLNVSGCSCTIFGERIWVGKFNNSCKKITNKGAVIQQFLPRNL